MAKLKDHICSGVQRNEFAQKKNLNQLLPYRWKQQQEERWEHTL